MNIIRSWSVAGIATVSLAACAPDAWQSYKATGFNDYLNLVQAQCQPLWIGDMYLQTFDAQSAGGQGGRFDSLLDTTSRLYYRRSTPAEFRTAVQSLVLTTEDPRTNRSIDCMIAKLPPDRPTSPPGGLLR
ncbi:MAG TPA: hypothetical protein VLW55_22240 [Burkholderiaceae bacterium]|nr:hypothetical protein [Burkholderiaceae bacterium]